MKKIGIVGGLGPEATVDYYKEIINAFKDETTELNYPEIIIYSVTMSEFVGLMREKRYKRAADLLLEKIVRLKRAGADFAAVSANTPHMLFDVITARSPLPLVSIVEATCMETIRRGFRRPGLFGTGFTMDSSFYPDLFRRNGLEVIMPDESDKKIIDHKVFSEIEIGIFKDETRQLMIRIMEKMKQEQLIDSLILGCTEFPLILTEPEYAGLSMLNTTRIHVEAIVKYCRD